MSEILTFFKRRAFERQFTSVESLMICAERPSINYIRRIIKNITEEANVVVAEDIRELYDLRKVWDKNEFEARFKNIYERLKRTVSKTGWKPSKQLIKNLHSKHLITNDGTSEDKEWYENLAEQIKNIRYCHLRSIAKKGADLDDTRHYASHYTPHDEEDAIKRSEAAFEVLTKEDIYKQAEKLLKRAVEKRNGNAALLEIRCMRPVKNYEDQTNSYNFLTSTYAFLLRENLKQAAKNLFPTLGIIIIDHPVAMLTQTNRTNASPFGRILKQPLFKVDGVTGKNVIVIDDHVNAGAFCATIASQVDEIAANVIGFSAYSCHPNSRNLTIIPELKEALITLYSITDVDELLESLGLSVDTLTNREALTLLAIFTNPEDKQQVSTFKKICLKLGENEVLHGINDNILVEMRKPRLTPEQLQQDIREMFESGRIR